MDLILNCTHTHRTDFITSTADAGGKNTTGLRLDVSQFRGILWYRTDVFLHIWLGWEFTLTGVFHLDWGKWSWERFNGLHLKSGKFFPVVVHSQKHYSNWSGVISQSPRKSKWPKCTLPKKSPGVLKCQKITLDHLVNLHRALILIPLLFYILKSFSPVFHGHSLSHCSECKNCILTVCCDS